MSRGITTVQRLKWERLPGFFDLQRNQKVLFRPFEEAREFARSLKFGGVREWWVFCKSDKRPKDVPSAPYKTYKEHWISYGDWLGTGRPGWHGRKRISNNSWRPFKEARSFARSLKLKSGADWNTYCKSGKCPVDIPSSPDERYKKNWRGLADWLGTGKPSRRLRKGIPYLPFKEARAYARSLKLSSVQEWRTVRQSGKLPLDIHGSPHSFYKDWRGWGDWLGNGNPSLLIIRHARRPFNKARAFVRSLRLKNTEEWKALSKSGQRPVDIPRHPEGPYKSQWAGWDDFLNSSHWRKQHARKS